MRTAYDAVTPSNIPRNAQVVMGYVNGPYAWKASDWALFPNAVKITIATHPDNMTSQMIDYENGDFNDSNVVNAVRVRRNNGGYPIVYCSQSVWPHVQQLFATAGVAQPQWLVAAYPGIGAAIPKGAIGHQYMDYQNKYDISVVADFIEGVDMTSPWNESFGGTNPITQAAMPSIAASDWMADTNAWAAGCYATLQDIGSQIQMLQGMVTTLGDAVAKLQNTQITIPQPLLVQTVTSPTT